MFKLNINEKSNIRDGFKNQTPARGRVIIKNAFTGEILAKRDNLIVNGGRNYIKSNIGHTESQGIVDIPDYRDFIAYFKIGVGDTKTMANTHPQHTDNDLENPIQIGQNVEFSDGDTIYYYSSKSSLTKRSYGSTNDFYILDESLEGSNKIIGKCPSDIKGMDDITESDFILFELALKAYDLNESVYINELGLFLLRARKDESNVYLEYPNNQETMFSRVTFDRILMDGLTDYVVEYYIYV